ncbi:MAG TPA: tyrosinase family protein [Bryobacteraceae bacterium]
MRLPFSIYKVALPVFAHHGCWHEMRTGKFPESVVQRCFPGLIQESKPGSGQQFLEFHRHMIRHFKWIVLDAREPNYEYRPWSGLPPWVVSYLDINFHPGYLELQLCNIERAVKERTLDELGMIIEGTISHIQPNGVHGQVHEAVSWWETQIRGQPDPDADMGKQHTAVFNDHFWRFHGWIDRFYARWQQLRGEPVDDSPLPPHTTPMCKECLQGIAVNLIPDAAAIIANAQPVAAPADHD